MPLSLPLRRHSTTMDVYCSLLCVLYYCGGCSSERLTPLSLSPSTSTLQPASFLAQHHHYCPTAHRQWRFTKKELYIYEHISRLGLLIPLYPFRGAVILLSQVFFSTQGKIDQNKRAFLPSPAAAAVILISAALEMPFHTSQVSLPLWWPREGRKKSVLSCWLFGLQPNIALSLRVRAYTSSSSSSWLTGAQKWSKSACALSFFFPLSAAFTAAYSSSAFAVSRDERRESSCSCVFSLCSHHLPLSPHPVDWYTSQLTNW